MGGIDPERLDGWIAAQGLLDKLEARLLPDPPDDETWYGWEPCPLYDFVEGIAVCRHALGPGEHSFLDVGCGIGDKLALARALGWNATGIERHPPYAQTAVELFGVPVETCWAGDYERYVDHDVIYCYRLSRDDAPQVALNDLIASRMRPGALHWCIGPPYPDGLTHVDGFVWRK
jgi:SAM-dependent methyltransferase